MTSVSDIRTPTTLVCGILALLIAGSTLLQGKVRPVHLLFAGFAGDIGFWYLSQSLLGFSRNKPFWQPIIALLAVLLPQFALHLFESMVPHEPGRRPRLIRFAGALSVPTVVLVVSPFQGLWFVRGLVFFYVFALLTAGLYTLGQRGKKSSSRAIQRRVRFLVAIGAAAGLATVVDFAWFVIPSLVNPVIRLPPIGAALAIVFLFVLSHALRHERLLDISELVARLVVATALAFLIALIFYLLGEALREQFATTYLNALFALMVIFVFDPLREFVEEWIQRLFFRERFDFDAAVKLLRRRLVHVLEVDEMGGIVMGALEQSRRVTGVGLYLRDQDGTGFDRLAALGPRVPPRVEVATARALLDRLEHGPLAIEEVEREVAERTDRGELADPGDLAVLAAAAVLGGLKGGVVVGIRDEGSDLIGLLVVSDDRVKDAYSPEEMTLLGTMAAQIGVVIENSRVYTQMKERDRLTVLGQMAAGLAHEIRNPLGAIKGAAQLLGDPAPVGEHGDQGSHGEHGAQVEPSSREFIGIILEEVDRLDRVVGSVLDLARPHQGAVRPTDVNAVIRRTLQVLSAEPGSEDLTVDVTLDSALPRVAIDPEPLRQVLINLLRNASQAMGGQGKIVVSTRVRFGRGTRSGGPAEGEPFVEINVTDNGPGISQKVLQNLFIPFFTTKDKGTGLGLAVSQRIVQGAGGRIDVRSYEGKGSTFAVILPAAPDAPYGATPPATPAKATEGPSAA
jgi:two-component system, NtrC family, sensor histidine kinase HydH